MIQSFLNKKKIMISYLCLFFFRRHKVKELIDFIQDDEKLREERKKAKKNKDKFVGMSNEGLTGSRGFGKQQKAKRHLGALLTT